LDLGRFGLNIHEYSKHLFIIDKDGFVPTF